MIGDSRTSNALYMIRVIWGSLLLMLCGSLFLLEYSGGYAVVATWPLLLILAGAGKLAEYAAERRKRSQWRNGAERRNSTK